MANNRLLAVVTMLIMMGSSSNAQDSMTLQELQAIESLISGKDWRALYTYVVANPRFTDGNDPLSVELQSFVDDTKRGLLNRFESGSNPSESPAPDAPSIY